MALETLFILSASPSAQADLKSALASTYNLVPLKSASEALKALKEQSPKAIIMDHSLSDYRTPAFIDKVRNSPVTRNLPFIIVSRETTNEIIEECVRAGVSHYIGMPFEPEALREKVRAALTSDSGKSTNLYFRLEEQIETQAISFGRISYVDSKGLHFETHLKLAVGQKISVSGPVFSAMHFNEVEVEVEAISSDVYYNYPFGVDAKWVSEPVSNKLKGWVNMHQILNSPKKRKILFVCKDQPSIAELSSKLDLSRYSLRVAPDLPYALESLPFMRPACFIVASESWEAGGEERKGIIESLRSTSTPFIFYGPMPELADQFIPSKKLESPATIDALAAGIRQVALPFETEKDRIYFSKTIDYSRCNFHFAAKTLVLGELGLKLSLSQELVLPCNLRLSLKTFTEQELRNPFVRLWPPLQKTAKAESSDGKFPFFAESHFLGITDPQGQAIRAWIRDFELKEKRDELYKPPQKS